MGVRVNESIFDEVIQKDYCGWWKVERNLWDF